MFFHQMILLSQTQTIAPVRTCAYIEEHIQEPVNLFHVKGRFALLKQTCFSTGVGRRPTESGTNTDRTTSSMDSTWVLFSCFCCCCCLNSKLYNSDWNTNEIKHLVYFVSHVLLPFLIVWYIDFSDALMRNMFCLLT